MRYVILSPSYIGYSAGVRALYELQKWLIRIGKDAIVVNHIFNVEPDDIAICPEVVSGNPMHALKVVRYVLNVPGKLGGDAEYDPAEIKVAYNDALAQYADGFVMQTPVIEPFFRNEGGERDRNCFWVGKGEFHPPNFDPGVMITHRDPATRRDLAALLNRCENFYTYDGFTSLAVEAFRCGCKVWLVKDGEPVAYPFVKDDSQERFLFALHRLVEMVEAE